MPRTAGAPQLSFTVHGESGPRVLMVMGLGMRGVVWRPQFEDLRDDHQLITYDARGLGESDDAPGAWTMADLADDALRVADAAGWERFHLVGVSLGGMVSQHVALAAPERLHSLTLVVTQPGGRTSWLPPLRGIRHVLATARAQTVEARAAATDRLLFTKEFRSRVPPAKLAQRHADTVAVPSPPATVHRQVRAVMGHRLKPRLHEIAAPTLVVQAKHDVMIHPSHSETLAAGIPKARLVRVADAGHGLLVEQTEVLNRLIREHVAAHERPVAS